MNIENKIKEIEKEIPIHIYSKIEQKLDGCSFVSTDRLFVIFSIDKELDNKYWLHVSFSRKNRIPDYDDIIRIKKHFIGENKKAIMIFPEKENHVNLHPYCLHLWSCLETDNIPDFTHGLNSI